MSRSRNKVACSHTDTSQKGWLKTAHKVERMAVKSVLRQDPETDILPERKELTNNYESPKDDKFVSFPGDEFWEKCQRLIRK